MLVTQTRHRDRAGERGTAGEGMTVRTVYTPAEYVDQATTPTAPWRR